MVFTNTVVEESKSCSDVIKQCFNKQLVMAKKDVEDFKSSYKMWNL